MKKYIWLIGAGNMAIDYEKVLNNLPVKYKVIGRSKNSAQSFAEKTGIQPGIGGLDNFLQQVPEKCTHAIVAVGVEELANTTIQLLEYGVKNILVEKPAGLNAKEIVQVANKTKKHSANVYVAYNRRFYSSVQKAKEIIEQDGGVMSFNFEFTEWSHKIEKFEKAQELKNNWFLANSTHVVDLAFFLGGKPKELCCFTAGGLDWHPSASIFSGAGITENKALFSYQANWEAPGRWGVEIITIKHRLIFRPLEKLQVKNMGNASLDFVQNDDELDIYPHAMHPPLSFL